MGVLHWQSKFFTVPLPQIQRAVCGFYLFPRLKINQAHKTKNCLDLFHSRISKSNTQKPELFRDFLHSCVSKPSTQKRNLLDLFYFTSRKKFTFERDCPDLLRPAPLKPNCSALFNSYLRDKRVWL